MVRRARGRFVCVLNHILWYPKRSAELGSCVFGHWYQRTHSLTHTHTVRLLVNHPRSGTCLSVHHMHTHILTHTHTHSPSPGEQSQVRDLFVCSSNAHTYLYQCSLSPGSLERGARGRLVCLSAVCTLVTNPRGGLCS